MTRVAAAALLLCAIVAPAGAQSPSADQRLAKALDAETYAAVTRVIRSAKARALPVDPIVDKALEGAVKGARPVRIRAAVVALADRMVVAREALSPPSPTVAEIGAGAEALGKGVPRATLRTIRIAGGDRSVAVPLGVLTELVARGVSVQRASDQVVALVKSGATSQQLAALSDKVRQDIETGIDPAAALDIRTRGLLPLLPGSSRLAPTLKPASPRVP
ncbi:MAG: hypothetical protein ACYC1S_09770 [Gemmatimonadaceae bacterium]